MLIVEKEKDHGRKPAVFWQKNGHAVLKGIERPQATTPVVGIRRNGNVEDTNATTIRRPRRRCYIQLVQP